MIRQKRAVLYARIREKPESSERAQVGADLQALQNFAQHRALKVVGVFVDRYGDRRTKREELEKATALCRDLDAMLVIARIGPMVDDSSFYEELHLAEVDFVVLQDRKLSRETVLRMGLQVFRSDKRMSGDAEAEPLSPPR
jgi:DNA invertase Pin-like site-specific DNA recombinase